MVAFYMKTPGLWPKVFLEFNICYSLISKLVVRYTHFSLFFFLLMCLWPFCAPSISKMKYRETKKASLNQYSSGDGGMGSYKENKILSSFYYELLKKKSRCNLSYHHRMLEIHFIFLHIYIYIYIYIYTHTHIYMYYIYIIFLCKKYSNLGPWKNKMKM